MIGMKIKELNHQQRPREKALRFGFEALSDVEVIAIILQSGSKSRDVMDLAQDVLEKSNQLTGIFDLHVNKLMEIKGISQAKALQLLASLELAKRSLKANAYQKVISSPTDIIHWFEMEYGVLSQEHFIALYLDTKGRIISHRTLFIGTLDESSVHPREIFKEAFLVNAFRVLVLHNHPSNDPTPSMQDIEFTNRLLEVSKVMGIPLIDHLIIGKNTYFSFAQEQYLD